MSDMFFKKTTQPDYRRDDSSESDTDTHLKGHYFRHSLELRELEFQSREYQKLAERLIREGQLGPVNELNRERAKCNKRISELRELLLKMQGT
ncbi:MAG: hypothetical protein GOP50_07650 [Candidatus Heimdallarchaeota archaeon]|nr:hypothetical protein [Candidatus Heimdallarchaeota archaeon]